MNNLHFIQIRGIYKLIFVKIKYLINNINAFMHNRMLWIIFIGIFRKLIEIINIYALIKKQVRCHILGLS